jgi:hypothetical protein
MNLFWLVCPFIVRSTVEDRSNRRKGDLYDVRLYMSSVSFFSNLFVWKRNSSHVVLVPRTYSEYSVLKSTSTGTRNRSHGEILVQRQNFRTADFFSTAIPIVRHSRHSQLVHE